MTRLQGQPLQKGKVAGPPLVSQQGQQQRLASGIQPPFSRITEGSTQQVRYSFVADAAHQVGQG